MVPAPRVRSASRLRAAKTFMLAALAVIVAGGCSSTRVYNWKPSQARSGAAMRAGGEITPQAVLEDSASDAAKMVWVAVPAGRDGSIVWVQMRR